MGDTDAGTVKAKVQITYDGSGIDKAKKDLESLSDIVGGPLAEGTSAANDALSDLDTQMGKSADSTDSFVSSVGSLEKPLERGTSGIASVSEALSEQQDVIADTGKAYESLQKPIENATELMDDVPPSMASISKSAESMQKQLETVNDSFASINDSLAQISEPAGMGNWTEYPWSEANQNLQVFQAALEDPEPFKMIFDHLDQTGQSYDDFTGSIGENNADLLHEMSMDWAETSAWIDTGSDSFANMGKSANESFGVVEASAADADKAVAEFFGTTKSVASDINKAGGIGSMLYGPELPPGWGPNGRGSFGDALEGITGVLNDVAMPLMAVQMIGAAVGAVGQGIYNMAAIAEGPAAHSVGTFTGTVDALGQTVQKAAGQFSEGFGQGIIPVLNQMNYQIDSSNGGWGKLGEVIGTTGAFLWNFMGIATGLNPMGGIQGLVNQGAQFLGLQQPFQGPATNPGAAQQAQIQAQIAQIPQQLAVSTAMMNAQANNPQYLAAQAYLASQQQQAQQVQQAYDTSHFTGVPSATSPYNDIIQAELNPRGYGGTPDPNAAFFNSIRSAPPVAADYTNSALGGLFGIAPGHGTNASGSLADWLGNLFSGGSTPQATLAPATWNDSLTGGCFPAGTLVLMGDGSKRAIETLQIGEQVVAHDGEKQVIMPILDTITFAAKRIYELTFADGNTLTLTDSHPIKTINGWKSISPRATKKENPDLSVSPLKIRDLVVAIEGTRKLIAIRPRGIVSVFNLTVGGAHTYYADGILVHNSKGSQLLQNFANTEVPQMDMKNTPLMQSLTSNFTGADLTHTFTATVTWAEQNLTHAATAAAQWAEQNLLHSATAAAQWAEQNLLHSATAAAQWAEQNLLHNATAAAQWAEQNLTHAATAAAQWAEQNLLHSATAAAQWAEQNLIHPVVAAAQWAEQNTKHLFTGIADWVGQNLQHTFTGIASWVMNGMDSAPPGAVTGMVPGFASGVEGFRGGLAVVGEHGPELVTLPQGASVYPQPSSLSPLDMLSAGNMANSNGPIVIQLYLDSRMLAEQIFPHAPSLISMYAGGY